MGPVPVCGAVRAFNARVRQSSQRGTCHSGGCSGRELGRDRSGRTPIPLSEPREATLMPRGHSAPLHLLTVPSVSAWVPAPQRLRGVKVRRTASLLGLFHCRLQIPDLHAAGRAGCVC